jgi:molecular chaperone HscB
MSAATVDYFELLGLPHRFALDPAELERRYLERSREVHPDRQGERPAADRVSAAGRAMEVNQAYRALRRELPRAEHLLALSGVSIGDNEPVSQELLLEMMELREALAEAAASGDQGALGRMEAEARRRERGELERLGQLFATLEAAPPGDSGERAGLIETIKEHIILLRYLARYREAFEEADQGGAA